MKAKIDMCGNLRLLRGNKIKKQYCPHVDTGYRPCGDWCPKFMEPIYGEISVTLEICNGKHHIFEKDKFDDER